MLSGIICLLIPFVYHPNALAGPPPTRKMPKDVKWVRYSVEWSAIYVSVYRNAWQQVKRRAANLQEDWAVVLDIDETVLDNSRYQEILFEQQKKFPYYWEEWVRKAEAPPVPGVRAFIDSVRSLGEHAHIAYITNRKSKYQTATKENLKKVGLWQEGDVLLCRTDRSDTKGKRRREVMEGTHRCANMGKRKIIVLVGDQLGDFIDYPKEGNILQKRSEILTMPEWGTRFFLLPNPMYGSWYFGYK